MWLEANNTGKVENKDEQQKLNYAEEENLIQKF